MTRTALFGAAIAICAATALFAQEGDQPAADPLPLGEEVTTEPSPGEVYTDSEFGSWELRCVKTEDGEDPCQLYQLLNDANGTSVAEISIFKLAPGGKAEAGATIMTPLETLLTRQILISVDGGPPKRYAFTYCTAEGCIARVGFTGDDLAAFRRGSTGKMTIVPAAAPDRTVDLTIGLDGFTTGFAAVQAPAAN